VRISPDAAGNAAPRALHSLRTDLAYRQILLQDAKIEPLRKSRDWSFVREEEASRFQSPGHTNQRRKLISRDLEMAGL
jgi:hypothetical protein